VHLPEQPLAITDSAVYELDDLEAIDASSIDDIVIALPLSKFSAFRPTLDRLQRMCKPIRAVVDLGDGVFIRQKMFRFGKLQIMDVLASPAESLQYSIVKRIFDIVFSSCVLIVASPVMAAVAVLVKASSRGPVLFRQQRVGLNGELFEMYKFRTMRVAGEAETDTLWTTVSDPRRTAIGAILRKTSLDEFPQFFNVLKGDMSVVGPRPERPYFVKKFLDTMQDYNERHRLKVGITGWAQVNGWRGDTSIEKRIEYDLYYMQNWSFSFDLRIILQTIWSGLISKNAY
jgi:Undecaprenyl-phosphate glucose phosphotransferase